MSFGELFPLILFGISIMFSFFLFLIRNKKQNLNEIRKTIREDSEKAIKNLEQKVVETEELVSLKQAEAQKTCDFVEGKIQELMDDGEELNQLGAALNRYRSMLAQLNLSTSQVQAFVIRTSSDAKKLQELQHLIDSHEKKTYNILQSFDSGIKEHNFQLDAIKTEIVSKTEGSINQIITTRDDSLFELKTQIAKYHELSDSCNEIQSTHYAILNELIERQLANKEYLDTLNKDFEDKCDNYLNATKNNLDEYLSKIQTSANDKLSLVEGSIVKDFEKELNSKKEDTLLRIDDVLVSSIRTIELYDAKLNKSFENSEIKIIKNLNLKKDSDIDGFTDCLTNPQAIGQRQSNPVILKALNHEDGTVDLFNDRLDRDEVSKQEEKARSEHSKKESKNNKKKRCKIKKSKIDNDDIDIMAGIDLIDLPDGKIDSSCDNLRDDIAPFIFDDEKPLDEKLPKNIGDINLDDLASIDSSFCDVAKKDIENVIEEATEEAIKEPIKEEATEEAIKEPIKEEATEQTIKETINSATKESKEVNAKSKSLRENIDTNLDSNKKDQISKKLNGTGFGNLLNSYGSQKRTDEGNTAKDTIKTFKPGSIIEMLVEEDKLADKKDSMDGINKNKSSFVVIGEEEEILLD